MKKKSKSPTIFLSSCSQSSLLEDHNMINKQVWPLNQYWLYVHTPLHLVSIPHPSPQILNICLHSREGGYHHLSGNSNQSEYKTKCIKAIIFYEYILKYILVHKLRKVGFWLAFHTT